MADPHNTEALETEVWKDEYLAPDQRQKRLREIPPKLAKLGLDRENRQTKILDLCCGSGETLVALYGMGFRSLTGIDIHVPVEILKDERFQVLRGDALDTGLSSGDYDLVLNIHSMHHFASPENVERFLAESYRLLKPGGRLAIIDFPGSLQIRLAFWFFRQNIWLVTPYLKYFGKLIQEEWSFLQHYLPQWRRVHELLHHGRYRLISERQTLFYFYLVLEKPAEPNSGAPAI